jgi:translation initiation factor IF-3
MAKTGVRLVEVVPAARPWSAGLDSQFLYQQKKKAQESRKKQRQFEIKEVKFRPNIDDHDYDVKLRNAFRFLEEGDKVKATVQFRGREMSKPELGLNLLKKLTADIGERGLPESTPEMAGNRMHLVFGPNKKPAPSKKPASARGTTTRRRKLERAPWLRRRRPIWGARSASSSPRPAR